MMYFGENFSFCFGILLRVHDMRTIGGEDLVQKALGHIINPRP